MAGYSPKQIAGFLVPSLMVEKVRDGARVKKR